MPDSRFDIANMVRTRDHRFADFSYVFRRLSAPET
jgi:hypothetical protein